MASEILLVCGMHRSGTSLVAKLFDVFGYSLGDNLMPPGDDNPKGFFEDIDIVALNDDILAFNHSAWDIPPQALGQSINWDADLLARGTELLREKLEKTPRLVIKDPRTCLLLPYWQTVIASLGVNLKLCLVYRNPLDIAGSLKRRNGFGMAVGLALTHYYWQALINIAGENAIVVDYDRLLGDTPNALKRLESWLGFPIDTQALESLQRDFIDSSLRHHSHTQSELEACTDADQGLITLSAQLLAQASEPGLDAPIAQLELTEPGHGHQIQLLTAQLAQRQDTLRTTTEELASLTLRAKHQGFEITDLGNQLAEREQHITILQREQQQVASRIEGLNNDINTLQHTLNEREQHIGQLIAQAQERDEAIRGYQQHLADFDRLHRDTLNSVSFRLGRALTYPIRKPITAWLLPRLESDPRMLKLVSFARLAVSHPIKLLGLLSARRVMNFGRLIFKRPDLTDQVVDNYESLLAGGDALPAVEPLDAKTLSNPGIGFPSYDTPTLSILIPVYNQIHYTLACLRSIVDHPPSVPFEVIVADDCSTDATPEVLDAIPGLQVVRHPENLRFLRSCNRAVDFCRGDYVFLLNNDTLVQEGTFDTLLATFESHENVGAVGSRLLYPDRRLQEAGGIVWRDGSAWNFGRLQDPNDPAFNYLKACDYISGAALMIPRQLFLDLGKFDERYAPSYYEDTDLCFKVRAAGLQVLLQPQSNVVHFEGISNGTDESEGLKAYQRTNRETFREKWREELERFHFPNGESVFCARDRSREQRHVVVIDHYVPHFDRDAGSRSTYQYLELLTHSGFQVTFIGDNFYRHEPYTSALQQLGIEVLYGDAARKGVKQWLQDNAPHIDVVYLMRPHIAKDWIDAVDRMTPQPWKVYFGHDLHYLRLEREAALTGSNKTRREAEHWKTVELGLFDRFDVVLYPSDTEVAAIHAQNPAVPAHVLPLNVFPGTAHVVAQPLDRNGLLFVGGFNHPPNADGLRWFCDEVLPGVLAQHPSLVLHIVGSNMPEEIRELASDNIVVHGFLSDEALEALYQQVRASIVPLRFGAGVKGKVLEAMYHGIPVFTTPIGAEGIPRADQSLLIAETSQEMMTLIGRCYADGEALATASTLAATVIDDHFSAEAVGSVLRQHFMPDPR